MPIECFLDTNVLIYAAEAKKRDERDERKSAIARDIFANGKFGVSAQTLAEFYNAAAIRAVIPMPLAQIDEWIERLAEFPHVVVDLSLVRAGIFLSRRYGIGYYDATLLAAAERLGARVFYSEDLSHGQSYGSVRVVNPFL
jgi:predicted nucleic acid-binding protein